MTLANRSRFLRCKLFLLGIFLLLLAMFCLAAASKEKPIKSTVPLSADGIAVYRAALRYLYGGSALNVAATTYPLNFNHLSGGCLDPRRDDRGDSVTCQLLHESVQKVRLR